MAPPLTVVEGLSLLCIWSPSFTPIPRALRPTQSSWQLPWEVQAEVGYISLRMNTNFLLGFSLFDFYFCLKSLNRLSLPHNPQEQQALAG